MESQNIHSFVSRFFNQQTVRCIHVVTRISSTFLLIVEMYSLIWIYDKLFINSHVDGHLGCLECVDIINKADMYMHV